MDGLYQRCRLGSVGNSSTASGSIDFQICSSALSLFSACLPVYFSYFNLVPKCDCSGKTLVHEFRIFYGHTEWHLRFTGGEIVLALAEALPIKI